MRALRLHLVLAAALALGLAACSSRAGDGVIQSGETVEGTGTVVWNVLEGGFYAIRGADGITYEPTNLPQAFQARDLRVRFTARIRRDLVSIHMAGPIVEILTIDRL